MKEDFKKRLGALTVTSLMVGTTAMGVVASDPVHAATVDGFLRVSGIQGESQDAKHKNEIDVLSYAQSFNTSSKDCNTIKITKKLDASSPKFAAMAATGQPIRDMVLTLRKAGKDQQEFYKVMMKDVIILGSEFSLPAAGDNTPLEIITLKPKSAILEYRPQKPDGTLGAAVQQPIVSPGGGAPVR